MLLRCPRTRTARRATACLIALCALAAARCNRLAEPSPVAPVALSGHVVDANRWLAARRRDGPGGRSNDSDDERRGRYSLAIARPRLLSVQAPGYEEDLRPVSDAGVTLHPLHRVLRIAPGDVITITVRPSDAACRILVEVVGDLPDLIPEHVCPHRSTDGCDNRRPVSRCEVDGWRRSAGPRSGELPRDQPRIGGDERGHRDRNQCGHAHVVLTTSVPVIGDVHRPLTGRKGGDGMARHHAFGASPPSRVLLAAIILVAAGCGSKLTEPSVAPVPITGQVIDASLSAPVAGATVWEPSSRRAPVTTDSAGHYSRVANLQGSETTIVASAPDTRRTPAGQTVRGRCFTGSTARWT